MSIHTTVLNATELTDCLLRLLVLRRHSQRETYAVMKDRHPEMFADFRYQTKSIRYTEYGAVTETCVHQSPMLHLLENMKINMEDMDHCTIMQRQIFDAMGRRASVQSRWTMALAMTFFGSRLFLRKVLVLCQRRLVKSQALSLLNGIIRKSVRPSRLFTKSFNPNRIRANQVHKARRPRQLVMKLWQKMRLTLPKIRFQDVDGEKFSKRHVFSTLGRKFGPFVGKNLFQILAIGFGRNRQMKCFRDSTSSPNGRYTETGPGARSALNRLEGNPKSFMIYVNHQVAADMYNRQLLVQLRKFKKVAKRMRVPLEMQCHLSFFSAIGETAYQFILCELSKICNYIETGAAYYTRNYWKDAEASAAGGLEDGEEAVNVRAVILKHFCRKLSCKIL